MNRTVTAALAALAVAAPMAALAPAAVADDMSGHKEMTFHADLDPFKVNKVDGYGEATVHLKDRQVKVIIKADGLLAGAPHAQHFHIAAKGVCPPDSAATKHNGKRALSTVDGQPFYGMIGASLTTTGDTSPASALAVDRFPTGDTYTYERSFTVSEDTAASLRAGTAVVVVHGIDYNGNGKYDNVLGPSQLDPKLPLEATAPALCGTLNQTPQGSVHGGLGGTQTGGVNTTAAGVGGALVLASGGAYVLRRRASRES
ncbi:LPXTG cell wall anchor domain-containing protein [Streptomyces coelicoflavus]|uniref:LPXTG cell wall anchor domain-containing protein n=1 Tax=Streptomyces coelicoflavus TaxID=285562 RepID=UPI00367452A0